MIIIEPHTRLSIFLISLPRPQTAPLPHRGLMTHRVPFARAGFSRYPELGRLGKRLQASYLSSMSERALRAEPTVIVGLSELPRSRW